MSDDFDKLQAEDDFDKLEGEPGHGGGDPYKTPPMTAGGDALGTGTPAGTAWDAASTWANKAALGVGPQIAGAIGAQMQVSQNPAAAALLQLAQVKGVKLPEGSTPLDAYRGVRDATAEQLGSSERTVAGKAAAPAGSLMTPVPGLGPLAKLPKPAQGAIVGGGLGLAHGLAGSKADLTKFDSDSIKTALKDALIGAGVGASGGAIGGGLVAGAKPSLRSLAETQALRAAGLRGGINNQLRKELGVANMDEARGLGRAFLDEGLIPPVGSSEAVGRRAEALQARSGANKGALLEQAQGKGAGADYAAAEAAVRRPLMDPAATTALERNRAAGKSLELADDLAEQGAATPGDWKMLDRTKSKAWRSANFDADPKLTPELYRQSVGRLADSIERQMAEALGPEAGRAFSEANRKYGVAADALKLAENASTRDAAKKGLGLHELMGLLGGAGLGGATGHTAAGALGGLAASVGLKGLDKYGHSTASRLSDFFAKRAAANTGGVSGAAAADALAPYLGLLERDEKPK